MSLLGLFNSIVKQYPNSTAIFDQNAALSYRELDELSNSLAHHLIQKGYTKNSVIGISIERSKEAIIAILAIIKSGAAYLPLDPSYPEQRLAQIKSLSSPSIILTKQDLERIPANTKPIEVKRAPNSLFYLIYTSGSTGTPKGVAMGEAPLTHLINWQLDTLATKVGHRTAQFTPLSFDVSFQEIFGTLCSGGELYILPEDVRLNPKALINFLTENSINRLYLPFVALNALCSYASENKTFPSSLEDVITAGEQLQVTASVKDFFASLPNCRLHNHYGPSETHVVTAYTLSGDPKNWEVLPPIGTALPHVKVKLTSDDGELLIGGDALAHGYYNQEQFTKERFITDPETKERWYRTGDLVRDQQGVLYYLGRADFQVKIRGNRVELGEVEAALQSLASIREAAVHVAGESTVQRLFATVVAKGDKKDPIAVRDQISKILPAYMVPSVVTFVDALPKTPSGKVDRKALPTPSRERPNLKTPFIEAATDQEKIAVNIWKDLLALDQVGINDNFFDLGGTSLLVIGAITKINEKLNLNISIGSFYQHPTLAGLLKKGTDRKKVSVKKLHNEPIAIIGMSGRFPKADNIAVLWEKLIKSEDLISHFSKEELDPSIPQSELDDVRYVKARGIINNGDCFDAEFFGMTPKDAALTDPQQRLLLELAWEALEASGYDPKTFQGNIGTFAGVGNNTYYLNNLLPNKSVRDLIDDFSLMLKNEKDYVATRIAHILNLRGPALSVHTACSTSLVAVVEAVKSLRLGECEMAIAGGASITAPIKSGYISQDGAILSPDGACRPFDEEASGTVFSDGGGMVVLKRLSEALRDNDFIYATIIGVGCNNDGSEKASFSAPSVEGQQAVIERALADAEITPDTVSFIEAHGTGTKLGDPIEIEALNNIFSADCKVGSIKGNFGHLTAAAGVAGLIKAALSLYYKTLPATAHFKNLNQFILTELKFLSETVPWQSNTSRRAGISSFGVGGTNAHIILEEANETRPVPIHKTVFNRSKHWIEPAKSEAQQTIAKAAPVDLRELIEEASGYDIPDYDENLSFIELGLDSLFLTQLSLLVKNRYGVSVTFRELTETFTSPKLLSDHLAGKAITATPQKIEKTTDLSFETSERKFQGPGAKISLQKSEITASQRAFLDNLISDYTKRTKLSRDFTEQHRKVLADPRVVSGFRPLLKEVTYPIVVNRSDGAYLWDLDGNKYIDFTCGFGSMFFGHSAPFIVEAINEQLKLGMEIGPQTPLAGETAKLISEITGCDRVAFCNTGSEAVLGALRIARTVTGKNKIVCFHDSYHGIFDEVLVRTTKSGGPMPAAAGVPNSAVEQMIVLEYGTPEAIRAIEKQKDSIAAVLVEPVQSRHPDLQPREFLKDLRKFTENNNIALIFDEVINGFRLLPGGAQAFFDIKADLATYGKVIGGGMPLGVIAGSESYMGALDGGLWTFGDDSQPTMGVTYFAGTFVRHPLTLAAAKAAALYIKKNANSIYPQLTERSTKLAREVNQMFRSYQVPFVIENCASMFKLIGTTDVQHGDLVTLLLRKKGIHIWEGRPCFLTLAHSDQDIKNIATAFEETIAELLRAGFIRNTEDLGDIPPIPGARRGKDPTGKLGWFIPDPERQGKYLQVK